LWFIGRLDDLSLINAIGLGNVIMNVLGYATIFGLNGALSTFVSQSVGAKQYELCGVYRWRARYIVVLAFVLLLPVFLSSKHLFLALGMDEATSASAGKYLCSQLPAMFLLGLLDVDRNFLACFGRTDISMYC
jgi:Na+-driven multidrug efflux pump